MEKESTTNKLQSYVDQFGKQQYRYEPEPHGFCVTPNSTCTMNYCDENGCSDRKRNNVELPTDPEWERYKEIREEEEQADPDLSAKTPTPFGHCPVPTDEEEIEQSWVRFGGL
jgi:hypothetical protein